MMNFRSRLSVVPLSVAGLLLSAATGASAQDINFICYGTASGPTSTALIQGSSVNQCTSNAALAKLENETLALANLQNPSGYAVPLTENNLQLLSYSNDGLTVTANNVSFDVYNANQGNNLSGSNPLAPVTPPPDDPSLGIGVNSGAPSAHAPATGTITVTSAAPNSFFQFEAVDLLAYWGTGIYTITGLDVGSNTPVFTLTCNSPPSKIDPCPTGVAVGQANTSSYVSITSADSIDTGNPKADVNSLQITVTDAKGFTRLDNIQLEVQVPEGGAGSMYLLLAAAACGGAIFLKRRVAA